jgi:hypothetical protein
MPCRSRAFHKAHLIEQIRPGHFGGKHDNKLSAAISFSTNKYVCWGFANDHWRRHDRKGNPTCKERAIILLDSDNPDIFMIDMLEHWGDLDSELPQTTKNWLESGVNEVNAMTTPDGICSGWQAVGCDAGDDIQPEPGTLHYIPRVKYEMTGAIGDTDIICTRRAYDKLGEKDLVDLKAHFASGRGSLRVFSSDGGKDNYPVFHADEILQEFGVDHGRACHLIVGSGGLGRIQQSLFLGAYNEACAVENFRAHRDHPGSSADVISLCSQGPIGSLKAKLRKQVERPPFPPPPPRASVNCEPLLAPNLGWVNMITDW